MKPSTTDTTVAFIRDVTGKYGERRGNTPCSLYFNKYSHLRITVFVISKDYMIEELSL